MEGSAFLKKKDGVIINVDAISIRRSSTRAALLAGVGEIEVTDVQNNWHQVVIRKEGFPRPIRQRLLFYTLIHQTQTSISCKSKKREQSGALVGRSRTVYVGVNCSWHWEIHEAGRIGSRCQQESLSRFSSVSFSKQILFRRLHARFN